MFAEVSAMFLRERQARNRRTSTVVCYESVLNCHLVPKFGPREIGTIRRSDIAEHFDVMREAGATTSTMNRALRAMKAILFFALERELVERNVLQRFRPFERSADERSVKPGAFSEAEVQAILHAARPRERALIGLLCFTGMRPGEAYRSTGLLWIRQSRAHGGRERIQCCPDDGSRKECARRSGICALNANRDGSRSRESHLRERLGSSRNFG